MSTLRERLQAAGRMDLGDFMTFEIPRVAYPPVIQNDGPKYEGVRFRTACRLGGKLFGQVFGVEVAVGDPMPGAPEEVTAEDVLAFVGIAPPRVGLYPVETHIADKPHAYTMPRPHLNSPVKDFPDMPLLASVGGLQAGSLRAALDQTFGHRGAVARLARRARLYEMPCCESLPPWLRCRTCPARIAVGHTNGNSPEAKSGAAAGAQDRQGIHCRRVAIDRRRRRRSFTLRCVRWLSWWTASSGARRV
jgi:hypothetical protein